MPFHLLRPLLHSGAFGWDEYVIVGLGLLVLIIIAFAGEKQTRKPQIAKRNRRIKNRNARKRAN